MGRRPTGCRLFSGGERATWTCFVRRYNQEDVRQLAVLCSMPMIELPNNRGTTDAACLSAAVYAWSRIGGPLPGNPRGIEQGSVEWRQLRRGRLTASVVGMALNVSPFGDRTRAGARGAIGQGGGGGSPR